MRHPTRLAAALLLAAACSGPDAAGPDRFDAAATDGFVPPGGGGTAVTVLTRNLYLGARLDGLSLPGVDFGAAALEIWNTVQHTNFPARARELALEIDALRPHFIGLQEVVTYTVLDPTLQPIGQISHLQLLLQELAALGLNYQIAALTPHTTFTAPIGDLLNPPFLVNFLNAEAILVRGDVQLIGATGDIFDASLPLPVGISIRHSWQAVDGIVDGTVVRFANTHLETQNFPDVQVAQTLELIAALDDSPWPVILAGDFNSAANPSAPADRKTATYELLLEAGFVDLWTRAGPADKGLTCCHAGDLSNPRPAFDQRIDLIFARNKDNGSGFAGAVWMTIVGDEVDDRFVTGAGTTLWPSDHAGVAAAIRLPGGLTDR